jgi:uncharacterized protein YhfF
VEQRAVEEWWEAFRQARGVDAHRRFFARRCARLGVTFSDDVLTVFERFELVWPQKEDRCT